MNDQQTSPVQHLSPLQDTINAALLNPVVSNALQAAVCVNNWTVTLLTDYAHAVKPNAAGVARVSGTATTATGEQCDWSVMLKVFTSPAGAVMPDGTVITQAMAVNRRHFGYWKREAVAYQSGLLACLPHGLAALPAMAPWKPATRSGFGRRRR